MVYDCTGNLQIIFVNFCWKRTYLVSSRARIMDIIRKKRVALIGLVVCAEYFRRKSSRTRRWTRNWLLEKERLCHMPLLRELRANEPNDFRKYLRMTETDFDRLLGKVQTLIRKEDTVMRDAIPPSERLIATLYFLASGMSYERMQFVVGISANTLGYIIPETCRAIWTALQPEYIKMPESKEEWMEIAEEFKARWQFINCGGAVDGKHIRIVAPKRSGAQYFNYKKFYSIVLMAIVNAKYEFVYVDVGRCGRVADGGVIRQTRFYERMLKGELNLPSPSDTEEGLNFVFIGNEAFALDENMMKVYPQKVLTYERRIFNYRVCRARNVVENAFGLIASKFRVLQTAIYLEPPKVSTIVLAICVLHNFLMRTSSRYAGYSSFDREDTVTHEIRRNGTWRDEVADIEDVVPQLRVTVRKNNPAAAKKVREDYCRFYNSARGSVPWQDEMLKRGRA